MNTIMKLTIIEKESVIVADVDGFEEGVLGEGKGGDGWGTVIEPKAYMLLSSEPM